MAVWQSVQPKVPWTLAACLTGSIEMLLPLAEVIPAWPWQARQVSSCFRGWGAFGWATNASRCQDANGKKNECKKHRHGRLSSIVRLDLLRVASFSASSTPAVCSYFIPRSVRILGFSSPAARTSWHAEQSLVMVWPSALV